MKSKMIGKIATITDPESIYYGEWGTIADYDGEVYYIHIADDRHSAPIFDRNQFRVRRARKENPNGK